MNYSVDLMEIATEHEIDHVIDKLPHMNNKISYEGRYILIILCFATPVEVLTKDGMERGEPGDCMIVSPTFHEYHRTWPGEKKGFVNDWIYVNVKNPIQLEDLDLPYNILIKTQNSLFLRSYMEFIDNELVHRKIHYEKLVNNCIEHILIELSRIYDIRYVSLEDSAYKSQLLELRHHVHGTIHENWTVDRMAKAIGLSTSRFSVIYRRHFHSSPMEDILQMRVTEAKKLLVSSQLNMKQIAERCGFKNEYYFSRFFKKWVGIAPSVYRRNLT